MSKLFNIFLKYKVIILITLFFIILSWVSFKIYEEHSRYHILVKFVKSGPLFKGMPVCFKGYRIGHTQKVTLSEDYKYTLVKIVIYPKNPKFPKDIKAVVKKHDFLGNYIDLANSEAPSAELLKNGDTIDGSPLFEIGTFLSEIADSGLIIPLIQNFSDTALSLNKTSTEIENFFSDSRSILKDNRQNLKRTTDSLNKITSNFNTSFSKDKLHNTTSSIEKSADNVQAATESIKNITQSVDCATRAIDKTIAKIDSTLSEAHAVASNAKVITGGFCEVLGKRFAGLRIIFGKPLNKNKCPQNCLK
ncbi:MAG: MlaD family protein [Candidatus Gastranaerophilaceae bacterium]